MSELRSGRYVSDRHKAMPSCLPRQSGKEPRQGPFDVWRTREDSILISDLGGPYEGVKDCYGLGISLQEAERVAQNWELRIAAKIVTTQRKCGKCRIAFWPRADFTGESTLDNAACYFCPSCLKVTSRADIEEYGRQVDSAGGRSRLDLSEWCG